VILLLLLEKYIRHFRTSRKARYFKKPHSTVNYMYSREDEDPHTKQWLSFKKRRLQLTSRAQELFSSFSPSSAPHPLMHWTHGVVSLLLSLLKVVSRLQRVTSRRHFFFKSPFPRRMVLYLYCIIRQQPLPIQNVQMLQVSFTRLGVGGQLRAAFSYYLHGPSLKAAKSRVGASS
jgi:hypothetical protein